MTVSWHKGSKMAGSKPLIQEADPCITKLAIEAIDINLRHLCLEIIIPISILLMGFKVAFVPLKAYMAGCTGVSVHVLADLAL